MYAAIGCCRAASHLVLPSKGSNRGADWVALPPVYVQHEHIRQEDLPRLYKAADAFVLPSRSVPWSQLPVDDEVRADC